MMRREGRDKGTNKTTEVEWDEIGWEGKAREGRVGRIEGKKSEGFVLIGMSAR